MCTKGLTTHYKQRSRGLTHSSQTVKEEAIAAFRSLMKQATPTPNVAKIQPDRTERDKYQFIPSAYL